jgi:hypothetical protein
MWKDWKPGNSRAAEIAKSNDFVQHALHKQKIKIPGVEKLNLEHIGKICAEGISKGFGYDKVSSMLQKEMNHPVLTGPNGISLDIAWVICAAAVGEANYERYYELGVEEVDWMGSTDSCPICSLNIGQRVKIGTPFKSGHLFPPCCPNCRCGLNLAEIDFETFDFDASLKKALEEEI